ncbi:MAG: hypothetical protein ACHREM_08140 [Polyangiales bacterium]
MTMTLTNTARRLVTFVLAHDTYCSKCGRCACTVRRDGVRLAASLTFAAGARATGIDAVVLDVPAIRAAVHGGTLRVEPEAQRAPEVVATSKTPGGPEGAPTIRVEVPHEPGTAVVEDRSR